MARKRKGKRKVGRPRDRHAKRNTTTREGRRTGIDPVDKGTPELLGKRRRATGHETLSHEDPLARLLGCGEITVAQFNAGREIAELQAIVAGERYGSMWLRIMSGSGGIGQLGPSPAVEWAWRKLGRLARVMGVNAGPVFAVCSGQWWATAASRSIAAGLDAVSRYWSGGEMDLSDVRRYYLTPASERLVQQEA